MTGYGGHCRSRGGPGYVSERLAAFTFRPVAPVIEPSTALMVVSPRFLAVAIPAALMEAMVLLEELHVTWFEMLGIVPSE